MHDPAIEGLIRRAADPRLIAGIYNYCDRRCERCPFTSRCFLFREESARDRSAESPESLVRTITRSLERTFGMLQVAASDLGVDLASLEPDPAEADREARTDEDPIVLRAREYAGPAARIAHALRPVVAARGDGAAIEAVDTIDYFAARIAAKTFRAVLGACDDIYDPDDRQSDANGSAKVARLFIAESIRAWSVLMEVGRATADGVPAQLVRALETLDRDLAARFPDAMSFVRPGFDSDPDTPPAAEVDLVGQAGGPGL
jgi:hypothetical protein